MERFVGDRRPGEGTTAILLESSLPALGSTAILLKSSLPALGLLEALAAPRPPLH